MPNWALTCNFITDPTGWCFSHPLCTTSLPLGSFCLVYLPRSLSAYLLLFCLSTGSYFSYILSTLRVILFRSVTFPNVPPTCNSFINLSHSCFSYIIFSSSPIQYLLTLIFFYSVTFLNIAPTWYPFTDLPSLCFRYNLFSTSSLLGSFCSVQSPPIIFPLRSTLLLIWPVHGWATTFPTPLNT